MNCLVQQECALHTKKCLGNLENDPSSSEYVHAYTLQVIRYSSTAILFESTLTVSALNLGKVHYTIF